MGDSFMDLMWDAGGVFARPGRRKLTGLCLCSLLIWILSWGPAECFTSIFYARGHCCVTMTGLISQTPQWNFRLLVLHSATVMFMERRPDVSGVPAKYLILQSIIYLFNRADLIKAGFALTVTAQRGSVIVTWNASRQKAWSYCI